MAEKYLNEGCRFSCSYAFGSNLFRAVENGESAIIINGQKALTNRAMLFPEAPGPATMCRMQPNPLGIQPYFPCSLSGVSWQKASKNTGSGYNLLTEASKAICQTFLGELSVIGPFGITCIQRIAENLEILTAAPERSLKSRD